MKNTGATQSFTFDLTQQSSTFLGFGTTTWPGDTSGVVVTQENSGNFVRFKVGPNWNPTEAQVQSFATQQNAEIYVRDYFGAAYLKQAQDTFAAAKRPKLNIVLIFFNIPTNFLTTVTVNNQTYPELQKQDVPLYAALLAAIYRYLLKNKLVPDYVELANEPDSKFNGTSGYISEANYALLVKEFWSRLQSQQPAGPAKVIGPGTVYTSHAYTYIDTLIATNTDSLLYAYSAHNWDDNIDNNGFTPEQNFDNYCKYFFQTVKKAPKTVFITEWATGISKYAGVQYASPDSTNGKNGDSAADQNAFAVTVMDRLVRLASWSTQGAPSLATFYYEAHDQDQNKPTDWEHSSWGLLAGPADSVYSSRFRPTHTALQTLFNVFSSGAKILAPRNLLTNPDNPVAVAFLTGTTLVLQLANVTSLDQSVQITLNGLSQAKILQAQIYNANGQNSNTPTAVTQQGFTLSLHLPTYTAVNINLTVALAG